MDNLPFTIKSSPGEHAGQRVIALKGPLTIKTLFEFQDVVRAEGSPAMILDLTDVPSVDSAGLGSMVNAQVSCTKAGRRFALAGVGERVLSLLRMTRVEQVFAIYPTVRDAEQYLASQPASSTRRA